MFYQCIRVYRFRPGALGDAVRAAEAELITALRQQPGFRGYRLVTTADDRAVSESTWETYAQAESADVVEAAWARRRLAGFLAALPELLIGPVSLEG